MQLIHLGATALGLLGQLAASTAIPNNWPPHGPHDPNHQPLPIVDLGYVKQRASGFNATGKYYNFTNIAFAQPPVGDLRFAAPKPPKYIADVQDGNDKINPTCPQAWPIWLSETFLNTSSVPKGPSETEDCLYLDVLVPEKIFEQRQGRGSKAPVLVWIYGGGFNLGGKTQNGDGSGLIAESTNDPHDEGLIFVALNYRLGAFGWLGGSDFQKQGGTSNAGLLDQRLALEWVQQNIRKFGGDPGRVTVIGESGGAASIGQHLTAGKTGHDFDTCKTPFQQAIYQSPDQGSPKIPSDATFNTRYHDFLKKLNVNNLQEARALSSDAVYEANKATVEVYPGGMFTTFALSIDGSYVVGNIKEGLNAGRYDRNVKTMTAYNAAEGDIFTFTLDTPPTAKNFSFPAYVKSIVPDASPDTINHISNDLYPLSAYAGVETDRTSTFNADVFIVCNAYGLQSAYNNQGFAYEFSVPPAWHTQDVSYTLFNGHNGPGLPLVPSVAVDMQKYFTNFAMHGNPNQRGLTAMSVFGSQASMLNLTTDGNNVVSDPARMERCKFWEKYDV
ncbi:hypothetical protein PRZ48_002950 [Zasmidium cellare]|uniref:Carboxylic ester hydrolase n=1 Tax=Zasmidium cellare TaxID=395010 RepID=A0ABR0ETT9_ZASCE|nr:hypothetical protein PRZ48_002950 [Zasmidium cellare]